MIKSRSGTLFIAVFLILSGAVAFAFERTLSVVKLKCDNVTYTHCDKLAIVEARSDRDTLYYLWDFGSKPTFLVAQVPLDTNISVDWDRFAHYDSRSVYFTSRPTLIFGTVLNKVYELDDTSNNSIAYNAENFQWNVTELLEAVTTDRVVFLNVGRLRNHSDSGSLAISICAYGSDGKAVNTPHLLHSANSSQIDIVLNNFTNIFNKSKFTIEFITFSSIGNSKYELIVQKTLDDENTPGIFSLDTFSVTENQTRKMKNGGYLQWRPIVYTTNKMVVTSSAKTTDDVADVVDKREIFNASLLHAIDGHRVSTFFVKALNITLGAQADVSYETTKYASWSFVLGIGDQPQLSLSVLVVSIIFIGIVLLLWISCLIGKKFCGYC